jgi:hypothetical protein
MFIVKITVHYMDKLAGPVAEISLERGESLLPE